MNHTVIFTCCHCNVELMRVTGEVRQITVDRNLCMSCYRELYELASRCKELEL